MINDKSQGSVATHLRCGGCVLLKTFRYVCGERIFKIDKYLAKLQAIGWLFHMPGSMVFMHCPA